MRLEDHYDWVVLGDHPAALLSASLVARLGLSVLILPLYPQSKVPHGKVEGKVWDPEPNFWLGLAGSGLLRECLRKLGASPAELQNIRTDDIASEVLTPQRSILQESKDWKREFGENFDQETGLISALQNSEAAILAYWKDLPERLTLTPSKAESKFLGKGKALASAKEMQPKVVQSTEQLRRGLKKTAKSNLAQSAQWFSRSNQISEIGRYFKNPDLQLAITGLLSSHLSFNGSGSSEWNFSEGISLLALGKTGGAYRGGAAEYREFLLRLAKRLGAHVPEKTECRRLFVDSGRFVGVQVANRGNMISVRGGVLGSTLSTAKAKMTFSGRSLFGGIKTSHPPIGWRFTISIKVPQRAIPPGMKSRSIWQEEGAPSLEIEALTLSDYGNAKPEDRLILVRTVLPFTDESLDLEYQRITAARMLRQLIEICPFIEDQMTYICPEFRPSPKEELREIYPFDSLESVPESLRVYNGSGVGSRSGVGGLFIASDESCPKLGNFGASIASIEASAWIAHRSGLAGPL